MSEQVPSGSPHRVADAAEELEEETTDNNNNNNNVVVDSSAAAVAQEEVEMEDQTSVAENDGGDNAATTTTTVDPEVPTADNATTAVDDIVIAEKEEGVPVVVVPKRSSDLTLALAMASLQSTEQKLAANSESDSRQLANNTAWHAASKRLTQWLSENVHKRAGSVDEVIAANDDSTTTSTLNKTAAPFAEVLRASLSEEFQGLADHMWTTLHNSLEELATLREERQTLIKNGIELQQAFDAQQIQHKALVASDEEKVQQLESLCVVKDELIATLQQELLNQKSTVQTLSQALTTNEERLVEKDALIDDLATTASSNKKKEVNINSDAEDAESSEELLTPEDKSTIAHLTEKLQRTEDSLQAALTELSTKGSQIATLSRSLDMVGEAHKLEMERALETVRKQAEEEGIAAQNNALKQGLNVDTAAVGSTLPTFAEASHFYLQGREEINALRIQLKKQTSIANKVDGLEMSIRAADSRVSHMVSSLAALEEEIQSQRTSERRLRGELAALRAEKSTLISQVVQLSLASAAHVNNNNNNISLDATRMNVVTSFSGGNDENTLSSSIAQQQQQPSAADIEQVINSSLSVIHSATVRAAAAAASSSSLVDSAAHQDLVDAHRKLKVEVNKLGKDKDYLEKLVIARRQRLQTLTTQALEASITNNGSTLQTASVHQAVEALATLASELATETRGTLTTITSTSAADALNDTTTSLYNSQRDCGSEKNNTVGGEAVTFEIISSSLIENLALKNTVQGLQTEVETLKSTIANIQMNQTKPISDALVCIASTSERDNNAMPSTAAVDAIVTVINSLMNRCDLLGDQNTRFQHSVETVTKTLLHNRKDSEQLVGSLKVLQQSLPAITQSVSSALEQHRKMEERLVASKDRIVELKGSLIEIQQTQIAEQQEMKRQIEMIGSKRPRDESDDVVVEKDGGSDVFGSVKMLASEAQSVASNVSSLAGALHGLKQLSACRKLIDIITSLEKELDSQQVAHASEIARLGSEFIKNAASSGTSTSGTVTTNSQQHVVISSSAGSAVNTITRNFNTSL